MNPLDEELLDDEDDEDELLPLPPFPVPPLLAPVPDEPEPEALPTEPLTATTVPAIGAVRTVPFTARWSASTVACADATCALAAEMVAASEVVADCARVRASLAACRLAFAV